MTIAEENSGKSDARSKKMTRQLSSIRDEIASYKQQAAEPPKPAQDPEGNVSLLLVLCLLPLPSSPRLSLAFCQISRSMLPRSHAQLRVVVNGLCFC